MRVASLLAAVVPERATSAGDDRRGWEATAVKAVRFTLGVLAAMGTLVALPVGATTQGTPSFCVTRAQEVLGPRSAAFAWARSHGAQSATEIPPSDGQGHFIVNLESGSLELIGPEPALQRVSWMGDSSAFDEWASFLDRYAAGQTGFVAGLLADTTSGSPDASVALADRTLRVMAMRASAGTLLLLAVKAGADSGSDASQVPSPEPTLATDTFGTACGVLA
jgi:hypothetical protein